MKRLFAILIIWSSCAQGSSYVSSALQKFKSSDKVDDQIFIDEYFLARNDFSLAVDAISTSDHVHVALAAMLYAFYAEHAPRVMARYKVSYKQAVQGALDALSKRSSDIPFESLSALETDDSTAQVDGAIKDLILDSKGLSSFAVSAGITASQSGLFNILFSLTLDSAAITRAIEYSHEIMHSTCTDCQPWCNNLLLLARFNKVLTQNNLDLMQPNTDGFLVKFFRTTKKHSLPLHAAVSGSHYDSVVLLLQSGALPEMKDLDGDDALTIAKKHNYQDLVKLITLFSLFKNQICRIKKRMGNHPVLCKLIKACSALACHALKDEKGNTVLHNAIIAGDSELALLLLERNPRMLLIPNAAGCTPLFYAVNHQETFQKILNYLMAAK